jgi:hypothetical protein
VDFPVAVWNSLTLHKQVEAQALPHNLAVDLSILPYHPGLDRNDHFSEDSHCLCHHLPPCRSCGVAECEESPPLEPVVDDGSSNSNWREE